MQFERILITGGSGFLGRNVAEYLLGPGRDIMGHRMVAFGGKASFRVVTWNALGPRTWDVIDVGSGPGPGLSGPTGLLSPTTARSLLQELKPDLVFHLAGHNGGIAFNLAHPADIFHHNSLMALNLLDACARAGTRRVVSTVASCAYGDEGAAVLSPQRFLHGLPHETVACHGFAKRSLYLASQFYRQQYGLDAICVCPTTLYGPGDSYDPLRTKVVGAMVKRFVDAAEAGLDEVVCWGTGRPLRELLYVADCVDMLVNVAMADDVDGSLPINLGSGQETSLADLAGLVADRAGYTGRVRWDEFRPDGQMRKALDTQGRDWLGRGSTPLVSGIDMTIADYIERKRKGHL